MGDIEKDLDKVEEEALGDIIEEVVEEEEQEEDNAADEAVEEGIVEGVEEEQEEIPEKKGLFGKKKDKKDKKDEQIEELTDRLKRQMAEFDNFRKRTEKEKSQMYEIGARSVIEKILPVVDNFERGLAAVKEEEKDMGFVEGMEKVYKQLFTTMEELGVTPIEAVGQEFDLNLHNAVMHVEEEGAGDNIVIEEFQKGYMYKETVVRHSMVKVAN